MIDHYVSQNISNPQYLRNHNAGKNVCQLFSSKTGKKNDWNSNFRLENLAIAQYQPHNTIDALLKAAPFIKEKIDSYGVILVQLAKVAGFKVDYVGVDVKSYESIAKKAGHRAVCEVRDVARGSIIVPDGAEGQKAMAYLTWLMHPERNPHTVYIQDDASQGSLVGHNISGYRKVNAKLSFDAHGIGELRIVPKSFYESQPETEGSYKTASADFNAASAYSKTAKDGIAFPMKALNHLNDLQAVNNQIAERCGYKGFNLLKTIQENEQFFKTYAISKQKVLDGYCY